jgi:hypothetical protein
LLLWAAHNLSRNEPEAIREAEKDLRQAMMQIQKVHGGDYPLLLDCGAQLAEAYLKQDKLLEAQTALDQAWTLGKNRLGADHPRLAPVLEGRARLHQLRRQHQEAETGFKESLRLRFAGLSDAELCYFYRWATGEKDGDLFARERASKQEPYLAEMARRGGRTVEAALRAELRRWGRRHGNQMIYAHFREVVTRIPLGFVERLPYADHYCPTLMPLTALRRAQGLPDPVPIVVAGRGRIECVYPELPLLDVALRNRDLRKRQAGFQEGGDYRSGRQARWRVHLTDARGRLVPTVPRYATEIGGLLSHGMLRFGDSWDTCLEMRNFVTVPEPGQYRLEVLYHDQICLADIELEDAWNLPGMLTCRSQVIPFTVKRRQIDVSPADRATVQKWLTILDTRGPVKVLAASYEGKKAHAFIAPESPPGRILTLGWKAVPTLLAELERPGLPDRKRAWIMALLFSLTRLHDPRGLDLLGGRSGESAVLGEYEYLEGGWSVSGGRNGKTEAGGFGFGGSGKVTGKTDRARQLALARRWLAIRKHLDIRMLPAK